ncbi:dCMP deaminase [Actinoplanes subtropicus]|uniref:dCMP deaminase n=1 Tax=Actinoplanes subtropicus TaxID=543632 RepID=UPI0004C3BBCA|nr:dCMP deaminase [Actinoplanes subtropicus]
MSLPTTQRPTHTDRLLLTAAIDLSRLSPPAPTHYAVGALLADYTGAVLATGYTGETDPQVHAEEAALAKLGPTDHSVALYTSLEPCTVRKSRPTPCTELILAAGITRVVLALREPLLFADCHGVETLMRHGVEVIEIPSLGNRVRDINAHLLRP